MVITQRDFLSFDECKSIIEHASYSLTLEPGLVKDNQLIEKVRKSKIAFYDYSTEFTWLFERLGEFISENIKIKGYTIEVKPNLQFTKYNTGEYYGWHQDDGTEGPTADRYCSIVIQLSDNYKGGELQYKENGNKTFSPGIGSLFIFPSYYSHRVTEVTEGERYSLVGWFSLIPVNSSSKSVI